MPFRRMLAPLLCLAAALGCGGGSDISRGGGSVGTLTVRFGSDSFPGFDQAVVSLEKLEGTTDGTTWTTLGTVQATYDLMALENGHSALILPATTVPAGTYSQFRLTWATKNYANPINLAAYAVPTGAATGQPMAMPATTVVSGSVTLAAGGSTSAQIMLAGQQAVQARAGGAAPYAFQATGQAFDTTKVASISGKLADGTTPLAGVEVYAETVDGTGLASIQRRAFSDLSGAFLLEDLPAGTGIAYFVVAQPAGASSAYAAVASAPVIATTAATYPANLAFSGPTAPGSLSLVITPASLATQGTWGELRQTLATGTLGFQVLIVRSQTAASGLSQDLVSFAGLAPLSYGVAAQRSTSGGTPVMKVGALLAVSAGASTPATLSY